MLERVQLAVQLAAAPLEEAMRSNLAAEDIARRAQVSPSHEPLALLGSPPRCGPASETTAPWARPPGSCGVMVVGLVHLAPHVLLPGVLE